MNAALFKGLAHIEAHAADRALHGVLLDRGARRRGIVGIGQIAVGEFNLGLDVKAPCGIEAVARLHAHREAVAIVFAAPDAAEGVILVLQAGVFADDVDVSARFREVASIKREAN